mmetsp:Transcript_3306/g.10898  ORF Transcript_3306/g.10898 Transcript_3306/m.10898 type:complete len:334 (-) Transcript_3306:265-1266(-)
MAPMLSTVSFSGTRADAPTANSQRSAARAILTGPPASTKETEAALLAYKTQSEAVLREMNRNFAQLVRNPAFDSSSQDERRAFFALRDQRDAMSISQDRLLIGTERDRLALASAEFAVTLVKDTDSAANIIDDLNNKHISAAAIAAAANAPASAAATVAACLTTLTAARNGGVVTLAYDLAARLVDDSVRAVVGHNTDLREWPAATPSSRTALAIRVRFRAVYFTSSNVRAARQSGVRRRLRQTLGDDDAGGRYRTGRVRRRPPQRRPRARVLRGRPHRGKGTRVLRQASHGVGAQGHPSPRSDHGARGDRSRGGGAAEGAAQVVEYRGLPCS